MLDKNYAWYTARMRLFLASEAKNPTSLPRLEHMVGGFTGKKIAYIPTAANGDGWESWKSGGSWSLVQTLNAEVTLVQLEDHRSPEVMNLLSGKDIIWFAGGYPGYLLYWIYRTELNKYLPEILSSNCIYVGSSAGSMITGENSEIYEWYIGEGEPGAAHIPPLQLVDFDIYPHFTDQQYEEVEQNYTGKKLYLLRDGEAIIVENDQIELFGNAIKSITK